MNIVRCCNSSACRACGVKRLTGTRRCWAARCGKDGIGTNSLDNDNEMRKAVEQYKKDGQVDNELLEFIRGRIKKVRDFFYIKKHTHTRSTSKKMSECQTKAGNQECFETLTLTQSLSTC